MILLHKPNVCKPKKKITQNESFNLSQKVLKSISQSLNKKVINQIALTSKFIQRSSSKFDGFQFLTTLLISNIDSEHATLEKISDLFHSQYKIRIRSQSIMERLNAETTLTFFKAIFEKMLANQFDSFTKEISPKLLSFFSKILIQDSSTCDLNQQLAKAFKGSGGRASKASLKLDVVYDFKSKRFEHIMLTDRSEADQKLGLKIINHLTPGSLVIRDLGYLRMDCIRAIIQVGGFFLSRMKNNTCVYLNETDINQLDLGKYLHKNFRKTSVVDVTVYITAEKVCARLIAYRVPEEISAQRRRAAHAKAKKEGRTLSQKSLTLLDFSLFITNVSVQIWPAVVVGTIYRIRWQIELMFKDWKSKLKIDCLLGINEYRIRCLIYIRAILILIINEIYKLLEYVGNRVNKAVSIHKVYAWVRCADRLRRIISGRLSWWEERNLEDLIITCLAQQIRRRKTSLQAIENEDLYYMEAS